MRRAGGTLAQLLLAVSLLLLGQACDVSRAASAADPDPVDFLALLTGSEASRRQALERIAAAWQPSSAAMMIETVTYLRGREVLPDALALLEKRTGQSLGYDISAWYEWLWSQEIEPHPRYAEFKSRLYREIDPRFGGYFANDRKTRIRLDEVRWGGVRQDGIPPLRSPKMIAASEAAYLADDNVVFGIAVAGDARAYPKRILAWHELFTDEVGGMPVAGVYCTLCGTVILYETEHGGVRHELGTSGFLYRSNKLMYDAATQSLWSTLRGQPVIGPLAERDITLRRGSVVTTTWGEWRRRHPETLALSLDTGHQRDYSEGAAYRRYFATDDLMFNVPRLDRRLANKAEVLGLLFPEHPGETLAIAQDFLLENPVYRDRIGDLAFVVLTDRSGGNRVYATGGVEITGWDRDRTAVDSRGDEWLLSEDRLTAADGRSLARLPAQRAFWFGWFAAFPQTRLVR